MAHRASVDHLGHLGMAPVVEWYGEIELLQSVQDDQVGATPPLRLLFDRGGCSTGARTETKTWVPHRRIVTCVAEAARELLNHQRRTRALHLPGCAEDRYEQEGSHHNERCWR